MGNGCYGAPRPCSWPPQGRLCQGRLRGKRRQKGPEVILALVAPRAFLDPALGLTRQVILSWAKRVALDPPPRGMGRPGLG